MAGSGVLSHVGWRLAPFRGLVEPMPSRRARSAALVALGVRLASRGTLAVTGLVLTALVGAGAAIAAILSGAARVAFLPALSSSAIAWGGGVTLAFGAALRALRSDRDLGLLALVLARGATLGEYVRGRVLGLVAVLAMAVGGATLVACASAIAVAHGSGAVVRSSAGALVYALVFSATLGPVAMAALGARTRAGGYLSLMGVLVVPELLAGFTRHLLPRGWRELTSLPEALAAVRTGIEHPVLQGAHAARALVGLAAVIAVALLVIAGRVQARPADGEPWPGAR